MRGVAAGPGAEEGRWLQSPLGYRALGTQVTVGWGAASLLRLEEEPALASRVQVLELWPLDSKQKLAAPVRTAGPHGPPTSQPPLQPPSEGQHHLQGRLNTSVSCQLILV